MSRYNAHGRVKILILLILALALAGCNSGYYTPGCNEGLVKLNPGN